MLKQLLLTRKIAAKRAELDKLKAERAELDEKREALNTREAELEAAVNEITEETSEEDRAAVDVEVQEFEGQVARRMPLKLPMKRPRSISRERLMRSSVSWTR